MVQMNRIIESQPKVNEKILIIGGYGQVGSIIVEYLAPLFPDRIVIAGRNRWKAKRAAQKVGYGAESCAIDILSSERFISLDGIGFVLVCLDQSDIKFAEYCIACGVCYLDISANFSFLSKLDKLDSLAKQAGVTLLLSVGLSPGLTNLLADYAMKQMKSVRRIDILIELGLGDRHGQAAIQWMLDNVGSEFEVRENGLLTHVKSFGESRNLKLPGSLRSDPAWRFNFSDQQVLTRALDVPSISTWLRFDNRYMTWGIARLSRAGLRSLLRIHWIRQFATWLLVNVHVGSDVCGISVTAEGLTQEGKAELIIGIVGHKEAQMTAIVAAEMLRQMVTRDFSAGVSHSEQIIDLEPILVGLKRQIPGILISI